MQNKEERLKIKHIQNAMENEHYIFCKDIIFITKMNLLSYVSHL